MENGIGELITNSISGSGWYPSKKVLNSDSKPRVELLRQTSSTSSNKWSEIFLLAIDAM